VGLQVTASGGLAGSIEQVTDDGALVRTVRGSLLRVRYGSEVRVEGTFGTLTRP
jgi:preprotein translocase subunit YajC